MYYLDRKLSYKPSDKRSSNVVQCMPVITRQLSVCVCVCLCVCVYLSVYIHIYIIYEVLERNEMMMRGLSNISPV